MKARTQLGAIVPQIQRLFDGGVAAGLPDGALLRRYVASGDEGAFATLVARHGGMVLGVCRGILRDDAEADDAFQAVFLVLVRKARSIRVDDSLGGWLHGVAYRVARRRNADRLRRAARERPSLAVFDAEARPDPGADPRVAQLHEEIARLPAAQRRAVVLCWLEGRTQVEAAREVGCGEATLRRRLSAARARLRDRLRDDDLQPSPPLPAVPPRLVEAAIRLASGPSRALASAVLREMALGHLAKAAAGLVLAAFAVAGIAWALMLRRAPAPPGPPAPAPILAPAGPAPVAQADDEPDPLGWGDVEVAGQVVDPDGKPVAGASVFRRHYGIRAPERKAATDAQGRFTFQARRTLGPRLDPDAPPPKLEPRTTVTRLPGGATITVTSPDPRALVPRHTDAEEVQGIKPWLVATAPGYGFGTLSPGDGVILRLVPDEPINGRLIDRAGRPVAGARVRVRNVYWPRRAGDPLLSLLDRRGNGPGPEIPKGEGLDPWLSLVRRAADMNEYIRAQGLLMGLLEFGILGDHPTVYAPLIAAATSDPDGRFTIRGVGRERLAELYIDGVPDLASTLIAVATRDLRPLEIPAHTPEAARRISNPGLGLSLFGRRFEVTLAPGRTIAGVVRDRETGAPLAGVKVVGPAPTRLEYPGFDRFFATTDKRGRYRIDGFPAMVGESLKVEAPEDRPYFGAEIELDVSAGTGPISLDFPLAKGVWITGRVIDDATGTGLNGQNIEYHAFRDNTDLVRDLKDGLRPRFDDNTRTNPDGTFRIRGYPGRGIVTGGGGHGYLEGVGVEKIAGLNRDNVFEVFYDPRGFSPYIRNTTIEVNIPEAAETFACEIRLKKGASRVVRVVGPDGRPRDQIEASGLQNQIENPMSQVAGSSFSVTNLRPGERRRVVARSVPEKLMGLATVEAQGDGPVTLQLRPWANVKGRLVDDHGHPRSRGLEIQLDDGDLPIHTLNGRGYNNPNFTIDADGRFHLDGLVPGAKYRLQVREGSLTILGDVTREIALEPGETRDLRDVRILPFAGR